ncbi:MAG: zinc ribbon domain-containing protein [Clostridia bacterium]|nr:zinc ribbon domain-containing protein [Clostridia bacterium]
MFCKHCGKEIDDKAVVCIHCGLPVEPAISVQTEVKKPAVKYCSSCGKELNPDAVICVHCGVPVAQNSLEAPKKKLNAFGLTGFILSICSIWFGAFFGIMPVIALIFSIIGMTKNKKCRLNGFSIAGLVLSIIFTLFWLLIWIIIATTSGHNPPHYDPSYPDYNIDFTNCFN